VVDEVVSRQMLKIIGWIVLTETGISGCDCPRRRRALMEEREWCKAKGVHATRRCLATAIPQIAALSSVLQTEALSPSQLHLEPQEAAA
jgi:hypothetical protein